MNVVFSLIFIFEAIFKLIAYGIIGYFSNNWNRFDFVVVLMSIIDIFMLAYGQSFFKFLKLGPQIGRVFRILRVSRMFKLVQSFKGLKNLIQTAIYSLPSLLNVSALMLLVFFIFSVLGVYLFKDIKYYFITYLKIFK